MSTTSMPLCLLCQKGLEEFLAKPEGERTMAGTKATWRAVEGTEETDYYDRVGDRVRMRMTPLTRFSCRALPSLPLQ